MMIIAPVHALSVCIHSQVIFGPMFSGKTTELMRRMKRYQIANYNCLVVKYANDVRYDKDGIATHDRQTLPAVSARILSELRASADQYEIIGIDEGQFFPDVVSFCDEMANRGKIVIVAALDGTFQRKGFGDILNLVPLAENVIKLSAVCMTCNSDGHFTKRITADQSVEVIGGADMYQAVCRDCYRSTVKKSPRKSPYKSPYKSENVRPSGEVVLSPQKGTPTVLGERSITSLQNGINRQLFVSSPPRI
ncbi:thymidine kinase, cytosolic-like isoform X2 [Dreissena polymorpha]|uniref:thymidine kinase, cytosolic-like isoform X2 n=1 Tax=Dreissena polymorpha TaxID=45954 RepID=UPI0022644FCC|nr:thymidine kinase, cytosolic-like isoform X2 [Dreissena polymorpha]